MTGGGHKASAEAIEAGFKQLYGDKYHFDIVDAWTSHTPEPFNRLPETYSFLVKNPILWRASYTMLQVRPPARLSALSTAALSRATSWCSVFGLACTSSRVSG